MADIVVLGPQRLQPTVGDALKLLGVEGEVCAITAGWQERAEELHELEEYLGCKVSSLRLYERAEEALAEDSELFQAHRERQNKLRQLQQLYRLRLSPLLATARRLMNLAGDDRLLVPERKDAIQAIRRLDQHHLRRLSAINRHFEDEWNPTQRASVRKHGRGLRKLVQRAQAVLVAGGHVAVLLNRLRLFGVPSMFAGKPVVAWSGGAMVLSEKLVLFHDNPPQGAGDPEVLEKGLGLIRGLLPLPHARRRLRMRDPVRVALFARRFQPLKCVPLDEGVMLWKRGPRWKAVTPAYRMTSGGGLAKLDRS